MITYKEFEVLRTILKRKNTGLDNAQSIYNNVHYYVFKSREEVSELLESLEKKGYVYGNKVTEAAFWK